MANFGYTSPKTKAEKVVWGVVLALILAFVLYIVVRNLL